MSLPDCPIHPQDVQLDTLIVSVELRVMEHKFISSCKIILRKKKKNCIKVLTNTSDKTLRVTWPVCQVTMYTMSYFAWPHNNNNKMTILNIDSCDSQFQPLMVGVWGLACTASILCNQDRQQTINNDNNMSNPLLCLTCKAGILTSQWDSALSKNRYFQEAMPVCHRMWDTQLARSLLIISKHCT